MNAKLLLFAISLGVVCLTAEAEPNKDEAPLLSNVRQLIFEGRRSGEGYFSLDAKALIFQGEREPDNPFYQIYTLDLFVRALVVDLAKGEERPDYVKVQQTAQPGGRETLRVFLGTIPDYATEVVGVKLAGIRGGSPAEKAGLKPGDVIVEFGSQKVSNIYDYTYALDAAKIGQPVDILVMRDGQRVTITITPEARK